MSLRCGFFLSVLVALMGCTAQPTGPDPDAPAAMGQFGRQPQVAMRIKADRTLVITPVAKRSCLYPVQVVYQLDPKTIQVFLADDIVRDCRRFTDPTTYPGEPASIGQPVQFPIPERIDLDEVEVAAVIGPLDFYPLYPVANDLLTPGVSHP